MEVSPEDRPTETCGRFNKGSDDGRATSAELNSNFTEGIFQMITSELPGSSWRILSFKKNYWEWIPAVIDA